MPEDLLAVLDRSKLPAVPEYLPRPLSSEKDQCLQKILRESVHPYAPYFLLLRQTGLRISELINLPPDCVLTGPKNEKYLKAIQILEKQSALVKTKIAEAPGQLLPSEVIQQLASFLNNAALIPPRNKKNLLLKMTRLRNDLANIPLSKNFTLHEQRDKSMSRWAG